MRQAFPILILAALVGLALWGSLKKTRPDMIEAIDCANPVAGCRFMHHDSLAQIRFSTTPEAMKPFVITLSHPTLGKASVSFQMVGMDMGFNRYDLKRGPDGNWSARIVLPVCTARRTDWIAELKLDDQFYSLPFTTR